MQFSKFKNQIKTIKNYTYLNNWYWAKKLVDLGIEIHQVDYDNKSNKILYKPFNIYLIENKIDFMFEKNTMRYLQSLRSNCGAQIDTLDGEVVLKIEGIKGIVQTEEDMLILEEIFLQGVYNISYPKPMVLWDIGMNVGFGSLYFASKQNVKAVMSYEPFSSTYKQALRNIQLNPQLAPKIHTFEYGIGAEEEKLMVEYNYEWKGSVGIAGLREGFQEFKNFDAQEKSPSSKEEISIKKATDVLNTIISTYPDCDIMAKIDCEGSEYSILQSLSMSGQLNKIRGIMLEWHEKGPTTILEYLDKAGFVVFSRRPKSKTIGTIYAVRP